jgi:hypothetical protein
MFQFHYVTDGDPLNIGLFRVSACRFLKQFSKKIVFQKRRMLNFA